MIGEFIELYNDIVGSVGTSVMGVELEKRKSLSNYRAKIIVENREYATIEGELKSDAYYLDMNLNNENFTYKFYGHDSSIGDIKASIDLIKSVKDSGIKKTIESLFPKIFMGEKQISNDYNIENITNEEKFYKYSLRINDNLLRYYEVPLNDMGNALCIYNEYGELIGVSIKNPIVKYGKLNCTLYAANKEWFKYLTLITVVWLKGQDENGEALRSTKTEMTIYQNLINKYDPYFIEQVKNKVGTSNLPENMSLVTELKHKANNTVGTNLSKIFVILLVLIFLAVFVFMFFMN